MNEAETRAALIDPLLAAAGWGVAQAKDYASKLQLRFTYADKGGSWQIGFYQDIAVSRALEAIASGRDRILLTLATGTGKTSIALQILWKLFQARWNLSGQPSRRPRILFLADRNTLADQAFNDFTGFAAFEDNALARLEPIDECHRGGANNESRWRGILEYFAPAAPTTPTPTPTSVSRCSPTPSRRASTRAS